MLKRKITSYDEAIKYLKEYSYPFNLREEFELSNISDELMSNSKFIMEAYRYNHEILKYASPDMKKDEIFLMNLFESSPGNLSAFQYVDDSIKKNKEFVLNLINSDGSILEFVDPTLQDDEDVVRNACLAFHGCYAGLKYASDRLKKSKEFIIDIVKHKIENFQYISDDLKGDYEVVLTVCKSRRNTCPEIRNILNQATEDYTDNKEFMKELIKVNPETIILASQEIQNDKEIISIFLQNPTETIINIGKYNRDVYRIIINNFRELLNKEYGQTEDVKNIKVYRKEF